MTMQHWKTGLEGPDLGPTTALFPCHVGLSSSFRFLDFLLVQTVHILLHNKPSTLVVLTHQYNKYQFDGYCQGTQAFKGWTNLIIRAELLSCKQPRAIKRSTRNLRLQLK